MVLILFNKLTLDNEWLQFSLTYMGNSVLNQPMLGYVLLQFLALGS
jgi:hypothetical protein